ncbi:MAG: hypothetical protein A3I44_05885 [Candidatus Sungbacteria bacterium RIFCSPLOWO2_02_FULL_51_17]|uniref:Uncharacterized protein n=1 Tax=Candidatus Sungbacteria bacterium RIFCSPHIGHO2_02_FULL_51_29 TaxID=1802273 RepID=A0A1G2KQX7_9BACT|nr:MAG: hypothetical protein A2676_03595 [Candidatus Sungbacteria bacterium RIFCSPHIGHO2_01_FULL_51_22]OHA01837.1 MAG: hypothetical protein A3C16_05995 [Candidatus Sungbacteria bacterium RIFCSPHIGHO2_02_FULL_51_29]OHA12379.1 MAG: hypothetical protein A3I44_05885 [Candidatus Sungbacteria bacterium RIFCSPLOWO2_02_FULL_51_17]
MPLPFVVLMGFLALYLLCGMIVAWANFYIAKERRRIVEDIDVLRRAAFKLGRPIDTRVVTDVSDLGFDAERFMELSRDPRVIVIPRELITTCIAIVFIFGWPWILRLVIAEWRLLMSLRKYSALLLTLVATYAVEEWANINAKKPIS